MQFEIEISVQGESIEAGERKLALEELNQKLVRQAPGATLRFRELGVGELGHVDLSIIDGIVQFTEHAVIGGVVSGVVRGIIDRFGTRKKPIVIRIGEATVELPGTATPEQITAAVGAFVDLANQALPELLRASDLRGPVRWATRLDPGQPYLAAQFYSVTEIIEAAARTFEMALLTRAGNSKEIIADWRKNAIKGVYAPAFTFVEDKLVYPPFMGLVFDLALMTPIDVACASAVDGVLYVEDVHPGYRLGRIVEVFENESVPETNTAEFKKLLLDKIACKANLATPRRVIESALNTGLAGPVSWGADQEAQGIPEEGTTLGYLRFMLNEVARAFQYRPDHSVMVVGGRGERSPFRPLTEDYTDVVTLNLDPSDRSNLRLFVLSFFSLVGNAFALALFSPRDLTQVSRAAAAFLAEIRSFATLVHPEASSWTFRSILLENFGPELTELVIGR